MTSNHLTLCNPLFLLSLSQHQGLFPVSHLFLSGGQSIWSFSVSPSNEYSGLISFRIDWCDLLAVHGTCRSLLQHHSPLLPSPRGSLVRLHHSVSGIYQEVLGSSTPIRVLPFAYLRLLIFLLAILIAACDSSSWAFHTMHSA